MRECPKCKSTDVPPAAKRCPFCGCDFSSVNQTSTSGTGTSTKIEKVEGEIVKETDTSRPAPVSLGKPKDSNDVKKSSDKQAETGKPKTSIKQKKKKKKHRLRNFIILMIILYIVYKVFMSEAAEDAYTDQSASNAQTAYTEATPIPTEEPESIEAEMTEEERMLSEIEYAEQYILPLSDRVYLTEEDLAGLSAEELRIARNEIYARHGRLFKDNALQNHFDNCAWYIGWISGNDFSDSVFNEYEIANKELIRDYENKVNG